MRAIARAFRGMVRFCHKDGAGWTSGRAISAMTLFVSGYWVCIGQLIGAIMLLCHENATARPCLHVCSREMCSLLG